MTEKVIAITTYGSQRVKSPFTGQMISAYKMGYTSAASTILLDLLNGQDVSPSRASYHYIHTPVDVTVKQGFILVKISADELTRAENIARRFSRADAYLWRDQQWWELPNNRTPDYTQPVGLPNFNPSGLRITTTSGEKEAATNTITVEKSQRSPNEKAWYWISGDTYPHRELFKRHGARFSSKRKAWYLVAWDLPAAIQQLVDQSCEMPVMSPELEQQILDVLEQDDAKASPPVIEKQEQAVNVSLKPETVFMPRPKASAVHGKRSLTAVPHTIAGELTGSITGQVFCYGFAVHDSTLIYLSMGGPRMAVEAIRAKLSKGDIITLVPPDAPAVELTAGEGQTGMYTDFIQNIPEAKFTSAILVHQRMVEPNYGGKSTTYLFYLTDEQVKAQLKHHVTELVNIAVFDQWSDYLWTAGQSAMLVRKTRGNVDLFAVDLDIDAWTRLITVGLSEEKFFLPLET